MNKFALRLIISAIFANSIIFSQWLTVSQLPASQQGDYPSISVPNCSTFVVAGGTTGNPKVFISTNNGNTISDITGNITGTELFCVWALNSDTIFAGDGGTAGGAGGNAKVYKTTNRGLNWSVVLQTGGNSGFIGSILFQRPQQKFGIIISDPPTENGPYWIAKTHDGGNTWSFTSAPNSPTYATQNSGFLVDSTFYGFGTQTPGKVYMTTNAGQNWNAYSTGLTSNSIPSISFRSDKLTGIAVSDLALPNIAKTTNGGINWFTVTIPGTFGEGDVKWIDGTDIFFFSANKLSRTSNNGASWSDMNTGGVLLFEHFDQITGGANFICAYALATNGKILKYEGEPFGLDPDNTQVPQSFILEQNYPNPFNPVTTVKYSVPVAGNVKLALYDINGREIAVILNKFHSIGNYIETIDMSSYASGVYFYELSTENITLTKKLALIK